MLELLSGDKKTIKLTAARDYYFPRRYLKHTLLSCKYLNKLCSEHAVITQYLPFNCKDVKFMIRLIASIDYQILIDIDLAIKQARLDDKQFKSRNLNQKRVITAEAEAFNGKDIEKPEEDSKSEDPECIEESDSLDSIASLEKTMESDDCLTLNYDYSTPIKQPVRPVQSETSPESLHLHKIPLPFSASKIYTPSFESTLFKLRKKPNKEKVIINLIDDD